MRRTYPRLLIAALLALGLVGLRPQLSLAATTVSDCPTTESALSTDISNAGDGGTVLFTCAGPTTIPFTGNIDLIQSVTLDGSKSAAVALDGGNTSYFFFVHPGVAVTINRLTLTRGHSYLGGAISNAGTLAITGSTLSGNSAAIYGGAIENWSAGTVSISNSTFSANSAAAGGGAIYNQAGRVGISASSFSGNTASGAGGAILTVSGTLNIGGTIIANSLNSGNCLNMDTAVTDAGYNLTDSNGDCGLTGATDRTNANPKLGALQQNGGLTQTQVPQAGSPAINAGGSACPATDQRGVPRPQGPACDIGAVEVVQPRAANSGPVLVGRPASITISNVNAGHPPALLYALDCFGNGPYTLTAQHGTAASGGCAFGQAGAHLVRVAVELAGDGTIVGTTQTTVQVNRAGTTTSVSSSANPSAAGQAVHFVATVAHASPGSGSPTGTVQFAIDGVPFGGPVPLSGGLATSAATSALALGSRAVTATYSGDAGLLGSSSSLNQTVKAAGPPASSPGTVVEAFGTAGCTSVASSTKVNASGSPSGIFSFRDERPGGTPCAQTHPGVLTIQATGIDAVACTSHSTASIYGRATQGTYPNSAASPVSFQADVAVTAPIGTLNGTVSVKTSSGYASGAVPASVHLTGC